MSSLKSLSYALILLPIITCSAAAKHPAPTTSCVNHDSLQNLTKHNCKLVDSTGKILERNLTYQACGKERFRMGKLPQSLTHPNPTLPNCVKQ